LCAVETITSASRSDVIPSSAFRIVSDAELVDEGDHQAEVAALLVLLDVVLDLAQESKHARSGCRRPAGLRIRSRGAFGERDDLAAAADEVRASGRRRSRAGRSRTAVAFVRVRTTSGSSTGTARLDRS
jgi:hypothetical protein